MGLFTDKFGPGTQVPTDPTKAASAASSQATAGKAAVDTQRGRAQLPYVAPTAEAAARSAKTSAEVSALKLEKQRADVRAAAEAARKEADGISEVVNKILRNPAMPGIVGRTWNPAYGMFGHIPATQDSADAGMPRLLWGGTEASNLVSDMARLNSKAYIQGRGAMKGQGSIQAGEAVRASGAVANLDPSQTPVAYAKSLIEFRDQSAAKARQLRAMAEEEHRRAKAQGLTPSDDNDGFKIISVTPVKK